MLDAAGSPAGRRPPHFGPPHDRHRLLRSCGAGGLRPGSGAVDLGDDRRRRARPSWAHTPWSPSTPGRRNAPARRPGRRRARPASARTASRPPRSGTRQRSGRRAGWTDGSRPSPACSPRRAGRGGRGPRVAGAARRAGDRAGLLAHQRLGEHRRVVAHSRTPPDRRRCCTACAASVTRIVCQPLTRERRVEPAGGVPRVGDLLRGAPALARPLLEQPDRVAVAAVEVGQLGLLQRGGERDDDRRVRACPAACRRRRSSPRWPSGPGERHLARRLSRTVERTAATATRAANLRDARHDRRRPQARRRRPGRTGRPLRTWFHARTAPDTLRHGHRADASRACDPVAYALASIVPVKSRHP